MQGQSKDRPCQHSRSSNLLEKKQIYNGVNKMECDTASYEQEWIRFVSPDNADVNALSSSIFECDIVKAVSNDTWMQINSVEANCWLFPSHFCVRDRGFLWSKTGFPRTYPRKCGRPKQLISPIKITYATTTSSSSRTTTSFVFAQ